MADISGVFNGTGIAKGQSNTITLDKSALSALVTVGYYNDPTNWKQVVVNYVTSEGNQNNVVIFDASEVSPTGDFNPSSVAIDADWQIDSIVIKDYDGGYHKMLRADLNPNDFDIALGLVPTSSVFDNTQSLKFYLGQDVSNALSVSMWVKIDSTDTIQNLFITTAELAYDHTLWLQYYDTGANPVIYVQYRYNDYPEVGDVQTFYGVIAPEVQDAWAHIVLVIDNDADKVKMYINGVEKLNSPRAGADRTFDQGIDFQLGDFGFDADNKFKGKFANFEVWSGSLDLADAQALHGAGYYQNPESYVAGKFLLHHHLMGDNPSDTTSLIKDNKGTADATVTGTVTFDTVDTP